MREVKALRLVIESQQTRIDDLEQSQKRMADIVEALSKLALNTAQNTGNVAVS